MFCQKAWSSVGGYVNAAVLKILKGGKMRKELVEALLVLVLKNERPMNIKQFCPISLCNITFKLITKVLVHK